MTIEVTGALSWPIKCWVSHQLMVIKLNSTTIKNNKPKPKDKAVPWPNGRVFLLSTCCFFTIISFLLFDAYAFMLSSKICVTSSLKFKPYTLAAFGTSDVSVIPGTVFTSNSCHSPLLLRIISTRPQP